RFEGLVERGLEMQPADSERLCGGRKKGSRNEEKQDASVHGGPGLPGIDEKGVLTLQGAPGPARLYPQPERRFAHGLPAREMDIGAIRFLPHLGPDLEVSRHTHRRYRDLE